MRLPGARAVDGSARALVLLAALASALLCVAGCQRRSAGERPLEIEPLPSAKAQASQAAPRDTPPPAESAPPAPPSAGPESPMVATPQLALVVEGEIVLSATVEEAWAKTPPVILSESAEAALSREVDVARLPAALARRRGTRVRLMNARGPLCEATIGDFRIVARGIDVDGHEGSWSAESYWHHLSPILVAKLRGGCPRATWARDAELPIPRVTAASTPPAGVANAALREVRGSPAFRGQLAGVRAEGERIAVLSLEVSVQSAPVTLVSVSIARCEEGCHYGPTELWTLLGATPGASTLSLRNRPDSRFIAALTAVDTDDDGSSELLFDETCGFETPTVCQRGVLRQRNGRYEAIESVPVIAMFHGMP